ncbi:hypothetical protein [Vibrio fluvialis]|uniref:hypothetical protein n=1 Tax=Vibrio fluvialis TaxID=676 RepID=UPI001302445F|nr:hypothetical protein [Vibrio fluvialis]
MDDQISIQETESEIKIIMNGSEFMTFNKSKFPDRQSAIDFASDILALFNVATATGEAVGLVNFINSLASGDYSKDELKNRARHTIASKYGDAIELTFE